MVGSVVTYYCQDQWRRQRGGKGGNRPPNNFVGGAAPLQYKVGGARFIRRGVDVPRSIARCRRAQAHNFRCKSSQINEASIDWRLFLRSSEEAKDGGGGTGESHSSLNS